MTKVEPNRLTSAPITPIVAPMWLGAERHGPELGATALHRALRNHWTPERAESAYTRLGNAVTLTCPVPDDAERFVDHRSSTFAESILAAAHEHACLVRDAIGQGHLALTIGGDHALAFGSIAGLAASCERPGVLWFDTHADMNTPATSPSGHIHGMPLGTGIGIEGRILPELDDFAGRSPMIEPGNVVLLGTRDIDPGERAVIHSRKVPTYTMEAWHDMGIAEGVDRALAHLEDAGVDGVLVSFDLDVLDPTVLPGTGTRAPGGLTYREASQVLRRLGEWHGPIVAFDMVELNPLLDRTGGSTAVAANLLAAALGVRML